MLYATVYRYNRIALDTNTMGNSIDVEKNISSVVPTQGALVRANFDNPKGILKSGLYVSITLPYGEAKNAVLVKEGSIGTDQLGKYLYVVNDSNIVHYRHIEIGQLVDGTLRQVLGGLSPQEQYVTEALMKVRDGMKVKPLPDSLPKRGK